MYESSLFRDNVVGEVLCVFNVRSLGKGSPGYCGVHLTTGSLLLFTRQQQRQQLQQRMHKRREERERERERERGGGGGERKRCT